MPLRALLRGRTLAEGFGHAVAGLRLLPVRDRLSDRLVLSLVDTATIPEHGQMIVCIDADDNRYRQRFNAAHPLPFGIRYEGRSLFVLIPEED